MGSSPEDFSVRAGHYLGELNAIHPFRDGNGRTQREVIRALSLLNGYYLRWSRVTAEQMHQASRLSFQSGDYAGMVNLIRTALEPADGKD
jgi:cell filamentation protein